MEDKMWTEVESWRDGVVMEIQAITGESINLPV